jgi:hypothetical protein
MSGWNVIAQLQATPASASTTGYKHLPWMLSACCYKMSFMTINHFESMQKIAAADHLAEKPQAQQFPNAKPSSMPSFLREQAGSFFC